MSDVVCGQCGAVNAPGAQFCVLCDYFLGLKAGASSESGDAPASKGSAKKDDARVSAPHVEVLSGDAVLDPDTGARVQVRIFNASSIVDGFKVEMAGPPAWLELTHEEISLYPNRDDTIALEFTRASGAQVAAQNVPVSLKVRSQTDPSKTGTASITLTVPRVGGPVTVGARPTLVRLDDVTEGAAQVAIDNTGSNYPQRLEVTGSDPEGVVRFDFTPSAIEVPEFGSAEVSLRFTVPELDHGEAVSRPLTITATGGEDPVETTVTVNQERSEAPVEIPLQMRLEPSTLRVRDCAMADLNLVADNRRGTRDRDVTLEGRDPEGAVRFTFPMQRIPVRAGATETVRFTVSSRMPPPGEEASHPFSVVAVEADSESDSETEATGTFVQMTSPAPITTATIRLEPEEVHTHGRSGRYRVVVDNSRGADWLHVTLTGSDPENAVRVRFDPNRFEIQPGHYSWGRMDVNADRPEGGADARRELRVEASDGRESVSTQGMFVQSTPDWKPIARILLTLLGGLLAVIGVFLPWMTAFPDYYIDLLLNLVQRNPYGAGQTKESVGQTQDVVEYSQPAARLAVLVLAGLMMFGVTGRDGKLTRVSGVLLIAAMVGYFVAMGVATGIVSAPMQGAVLVVAGGIVGYIGGLLAKR
ncbi:hypothetical protein DEU38_12323 [Rhodococcus sp. AG1013]|uniref:COG1470 family protein n=1 Tax=Rhodococcus sp. AG1013 TaxID=2183996 RepID=UPI000E2B0582|nr:hypothetical protein [Rhodococcus sp. AG1013]RDI17188.1 hypothetical protein DEU38_12323 [Rhodococcus sp. AG1013]